MNPAQLSLDHLVHRDDPASSREAVAGHADLTTNRKRVEGAVVLWPGRTVLSYAHVTGLSQTETARRLSDLKRLGRVQRGALVREETGRRYSTWYPNGAKTDAPARGTRGVAGVVSPGTENSVSVPEIRDGHWVCTEHRRRMRVTPPASGDGPTATRYECAGNCYWVRTAVDAWQHDGQRDRHPRDAARCTEPNTWVPSAQLSLLPLEAS